MPEQIRPHLFLLNPRGEKKTFDATRAYIPPEVNQKPAEAYRAQKVILGEQLESFITDRNDRFQHRTLNLPSHIEFIKIDFFVVFNNNDAFKNKSRFNKDFGLTPVVYSNFNQSVIFAISDLDKFKFFIELLNAFINSADTRHPSSTNYSIVTIIKGFEFISTKKIISNNIGTDIFISLVNPAQEISEGFDSLFDELNMYLSNLKNQNNIEDYITDDTTIIQVKGADLGRVQEIADNFDIIYRIASIRVPTIRPNVYNQPELTWGMDILPPPDKEVLIGILDNGIRKIQPLDKVILDLGLDITSDQPNPLNATSPHGTVVACLAAVGIDYFNFNNNEFVSDAFIVPIKILNFDEGYFNIYDIEKAIIKAYKKGVKIFNLSVCGPTKNYNSTISEYAFLLDRLAFKYDLLIFIATGNLSHQDIEAMMQESADGLHSYPNHFYNPLKSSNSHVCESTNICAPAESMNNVTVGAIADNCNENAPCDLTPFKELPAYYTRKHYLDYIQKVNGTFFSESQKNIHINKPDIVMPGGDLLNNSSGMRVLGFGTQANDFFYNDAGTSFAAPLAANIAAKLLRLYPKLNMQSIKALILNGSQQLLKDEFLDDLIGDIKIEQAETLFQKNIEDLDSAQKRYLNTNLSAKNLYFKLVGFGQPDIQKVLYSSEKSVTVVIQDSLFVDSYKAVNINIPEYLLNYSKPSYIISVKATLCYKFFPVVNNHLAYNPLHISFNFVKSLEKDNPSRTAEIISDRNDAYFNQFYNEGDNDKEKRTARKKALGIKSEIQSWSEDFYPKSNKPFSNVQSLDIKINSDEIYKVNKQISLIIRSTCKVDLNKDLLDWLKASPHEFSIAINIAEKGNNELNDFDLYNELFADNDLIQISELDLALDQDIILEADI